MICIYICRALQHGVPVNVQSTNVEHMQQNLSALDDNYLTLTSKQMAAMDNFHIQYTQKVFNPSTAIIF